MLNQKAILLNQLKARYQHCTNCPLGNPNKTHVVFGEGDPNASIMFIGEAPGKDEDLQGRPFVGRSGKLLTKALLEIGLEREKVYITNIVKCRPPNNRKPTFHEMQTYKQLLLDQEIQIMRPTIICTLGSSALEGLLGRSVKITQEHGSIIQHNNLRIIPTFHPAYILRNLKKLPTLIEDLRLVVNEACK